MRKDDNMLGTIVTWGVIGACSAVVAGLLAWTGVKAYLDPERQRKRRAARNQAWVRARVAQNGVMARSIDHEAHIIAAALIELEDPWKHLESK
jgi:hypothetical protein